MAASAFSGGNNLNTLCNLHCVGMLVTVTHCAVWWSLADGWGGLHLLRNLCACIHCTVQDTDNIFFVDTVWAEILAGRYFGRLLKICHLAEFTLAVGPVLATMIFIAKWLIERAGNLTRP